MHQNRLSQDLVHFLCATCRCAPENGEPGARPGSLNVCYWLKHSRLGVTHLLSTGASKSRVVVGDFEFSTRSEERRGSSDVCSSDLKAGLFECLLLVKA